MDDAVEIINAMDRMRPQGLITDSVFREEISQGQAYLRFMGLSEVAGWLTGYFGTRNSWFDHVGQYPIQVNGRLQGSDNPVEEAGAILRGI